MEKFAVKVDLSGYFADERKLSLVLVDPAWYISCLQKRVASIFDVDIHGFLSDDGCFLPPQESVEVVRGLPVIRAFIPVGSLESKTSKEKKSKQKAAKQAAANTALADLNSDVQLADCAVARDERQKKRKLFTLDGGFSSSTPNDAKRSRKSSVHSSVGHLIKFINNSNEITSTVSEQKGVRRKKKHSPPEINATSTDSTSPRESSPQLPNVENIDADADAVVDTKQEQLETEATEDSKPKRKRKHKKGQKGDAEEAALTTELLPVVYGDVPTLAEQLCNASPRTSAVRPSTVLSNSDDFSAREHIYYNDRGEKVSTTTVPEAKTTPQAPHNVSKSRNFIFRCSLEDSSMRAARVFAVKTRTPIEIREHIVIKPMDVTVQHSQLSEAQAQDLIMANSTALSNSMLNKTQEETSVQDIATNMEISSNDCISSEHKTMFEPNSINANSTECAQDSTTETKIDLGDETVASKTTQSVYESSVIALDEEDDDEETADVIELSETEEVVGGDDCSVVAKSRANESHSETTTAAEDNFPVSIENILPLATPLHTLPDQGDIVLFKLSLLGNNGRTNYIAGKCEHTNKRTKNIKINVFDGQTELSKISARFACNLDDSRDNQYLNVKLTEMFQAKVFRMT